jgi:hypothetical protein
MPCHYNFFGTYRFYCWQQKIWIRNKKQARELRHGGRWAMSPWPTKWLTMSPWPTKANSPPRDHRQPDGWEPETGDDRTPAQAAPGSAAMLGFGLWIAAAPPHRHRSRRSAAQPPLSSWSCSQLPSGRGRRPLARAPRHRVSVDRRRVSPSRCRHRGPAPSGPAPSLQPSATALLRRDAECRAPEHPSPQRPTG